MNVTEILEKYKEKPVFESIKPGDFFWSVTTGLVMIYLKKNYYNREAFRTIDVGGYTNSMVYWHSVAHAQALVNFIYIPIEGMSETDLVVAVNIAKALEKKKEFRGLGIKMTQTLNKLIHESSSA